MSAGEAEEGGDGKTIDGTGLGEGDTTGAKDISNEVRGWLVAAGGRAGIGWLLGTCCLAWWCSVGMSLPILLGHHL